MTAIEKERRKEIALIISKLTLEEKVSLMLHESMAVPRLGIEEFHWWGEGLHGVGRRGYATVFPQAINLASTFDTELVRKVADIISTEARAKHNEAFKAGQKGRNTGLTFWSPNINIARDPRWGRAQETYGEDPCLTSRIGASFVRGLQGDDPDNLKVAACAKHFAVHSGPEKNRHIDNIKPSKKDLVETYLYAFKALVDAKVEGIMGAYQRLYDEPCCGSEFLLNDILRKKWGFKGYVVSDCWAVRDFHETHKVTKTPAESAAKAINAGCDLNCGCTYHAAIDAVRQGILSEDKINESLERLLMTRFKIGHFDDESKSRWASLGKNDVDTEENRQVALEAAEKSVVLLKNHNGILPVKKTVKRIMIMGPMATNALALLGNYYGLNSKLVTVLEGIVKASEDRADLNLDYVPGVGMYGESKQRGWTVGMAENADLVIACFGLDGMMEGEEGEAVETERGDRDSIELPDWQADYLRAVRERGTPVVLVLTGGSAIAFPEDLADAIVFAGYPGEEGGTAVGNILFGKTNPSGRLAMTFPKKTGDLPPFEDYSMKERTYRYSTKEPLFPFGFGLSYSRFEFDSLECSSRIIEKGCRIHFSCSVKNIGEYDGDEVCQIYVSKESCRKPDDPICALKEFKRVSLQKNESQKIEFDLDDTAFETINENGDSVLESGTYKVMVCDCAPVSSEKAHLVAKPACVYLEVK